MFPRADVPDHVGGDLAAVEQQLEDVVCPEFAERLDGDGKQRAKGSVGDGSFSPFFPRFLLLVVARQSSPPHHGWQIARLQRTRSGGLAHSPPFGEGFLEVLLDKIRRFSCDDTAAFGREMDVIGKQIRPPAVFGTDVK